MSSMIETLIGSGVVRPDAKRLVPTRRPLPARPRDLFEILVSLGPQAVLESIYLAADLRAADPRGLTFITLNRWPTQAELDALPAPYNARRHLAIMLTSREFRTGLVRRICDAYPERPRLCFVRIPRCAGQHFLTMAGHMHPIMPPGLATRTRNDENHFIPALGTLLGRFTLTKTIMIVQPTLAAFTQSAGPAPNPAYAEDGLQWALNPPPRRHGTDRLFTILREPASLILSEVNATLDALLQPAAADTPSIAAWRARLPINPATADAAGRKLLAREILRTLPTRNPICHALADGTAAGALAAVRLQDVELADLSHYPDWTKYTWDVEPEPASNTSTCHLTLADLTAAELVAFRALIAEDLLFYAPVKAALDNLGELKPSIRGRML